MPLIDCIVYVCIFLYMVFLCAANCTNTTTPESSTEPPDTTESDEDPTAMSPLFEVIWIVCGAVAGLIVVSVNICIAMICILKFRKKRQQMNKSKTSNLEMINYN